MYIEYMGLTPKGDFETSHMHFSGAYEYHIMGQTVHLRCWRRNRFPLTCSIAGLAEVPQLLVNTDGGADYGWKLFTAILPDYNEMRMTSIQQPNGYHSFEPLWKYDEERGVRTLAREVPLDMMTQVWESSETAKSFWDDWGYGKLPAAYFEMNQLLKEQKKCQNCG